MVLIYFYRTLNIFISLISVAFGILYINFILIFSISNEDFSKNIILNFIFLDYCKYFILIYYLIFTFALKEICKLFFEIYSQKTMTASFDKDSNIYDKNKN